MSIINFGSMEFKDMRNPENDMSNAKMRSTNEVPCPLVAGR
jgi:hypothetical protein